MNNQSILKWSRDFFIKKFIKVIIPFIIIAIIEVILNYGLFAIDTYFINISKTSMFTTIAIPLLIGFVEGLIAYILNIGTTKYLIQIYEDKKGNISDLFHGFKFFTPALIVYFILYFIVVIVSIILIFLITHLPNKVYLWFFQILFSLKSEIAVTLFIGAIGFLIVVLFVRIISPYAIVPLLISDDNYNKMGSSQMITISKNWMGINKSRYSGIVLYYYVILLLIQIILNLILKNTTYNIGTPRQIIDIIFSAIISIELTLSTTKLLYEIKQENEGKPDDTKNRIDANVPLPNDLNNPYNLKQMNNMNQNNNMVSNNQTLPDDLNNPYNLKQMNNMNQNNSMVNNNQTLPDDLNNPYNLKQMSIQQLQNNYSNTNNNQHNVQTPKETVGISSMYNQNNQGVVLPQSVCPNCKTTISNGNTNCPNCGYQIVK